MPVVITSAGTAVAPTGHPGQSHLIYAVNSALWWLFWVDGGSQTTLRTASSPDLTTWTTRSTFTLSDSQDRGRNMAVAYKNISSTDVVFVVNNYFLTSSNQKARYVRATISGTTITFGTEADVLSASATGDAANDDGGPVALFASDNKVHVVQSMTDGAGGWGGAFLVSATNADTGSSWTAGFSAKADMQNANNYSQNHYLAAQASGNVLWVGDNADSSLDAFTDIRWKRQSSWTNTFTGSALAAALGTAQDQNDFAVVRQDDTHVHLVTRTGSNTYTHRTFNGTSWAAGSSITNQTSKATAGIFLATDGTDVWLFIIDSDAANTIRYVKYTTSGATWGTWTALVSTTKTRNWLSGYQTAVSSTIAIIWSETNGSNFDVVTESLSTGGAAAASAVPLPQVRTPQAILAR